MKHLRTIWLLSCPWWSLLMVWRYGLHAATLITAGLCGAALLLAIGMVIGEERRA